MPGVFPDLDAGGVVVRNAAGVCQNPPEVFQAYCPPASFITSCEITALPTNCNARIEASQVNAIVSELVSFAQCLDANGPWTCSSLQNLCNAFNTWKVTGIVPSICGNKPAHDALAVCLRSTDTGNALALGTDGGFFMPIVAAGAGVLSDNTIDGNGLAGAELTINALATVQKICATDAAGDAMASCLRSLAGGNALTLGADGRLYVPTVAGMTAASIVNLIQSDPAAFCDLAVSMAARLNVQDTIFISSGGIGISLPANGTQAVGTIIPTGLPGATEFITNSDPCLTMHVAVHGDVNFSMSHNGIGPGSQQATAHARVDGGAWATLSSTAPIVAYGSANRLENPGSIQRGAMHFTIAPGATKRVDGAVGLVTGGAPVRRGVSYPSTVGGSVWYTTWY